MQGPWRVWRLYFYLLLGMMAGSGCTRSPAALSPAGVIRVPAIDPGSWKAGGVFVAGIGKVDITPPPGLPLFGYSRVRTGDAAGVRTRLYARALYLEDARGEHVVLVQCDLGAISALLHLQVARAIVQETGISVDRLLIGATHTHAGPGGYFGTAYYNFWGSNRPGYDPSMVTFLTERIANAVLAAYRTRAPAKLAIGHIAIFGLTHNRSLEAYNNNKSQIVSEEILWTMLPEYRAVDPTFTMLRVDRIVGARTQPLGAFTNFAIHSTAVPPSNDLYSGDVHAAAERGLEWAIRQRYGVQTEIVHALTNGAEGDVAPAFTTQNFAEAEQVGLSLAAKAFELFQDLDTRLTDTVQLAYNYEELPLRIPYTVDDLVLCQQAMVGVPVLGGSEEGRSSSLGKLLGVHEGARQEAPQGCHTWKLKALDFLQDLIPDTDFPTTMTLQTMRINELLLVAVPGEMSTEMGQRVKQAALQAAQYTRQGITQVAIVGLANQYISYFTTPEEYAMQHYEGASTLYGPASGPVLAARLGYLVAQMATRTTPPVLPAQWSFRPGLKVQAFPEVRSMQGGREAQRVTLDHSTTPPSASFVWEDLSPGAIVLDAPLVHLETQSRDGSWAYLFVDSLPVDDQGLHIEIRYLREASRAGAGVWQAAWYPQTAPSGPLRFVIAPRGTLPPLYSEPFTFVP
ncbi:MAG TPA: neutral/alkaline non-lysosomal ceramidase N-terminal domain-containing protein [Candidatus Tectomicrobia bacterium]